MGSPAHSCHHTASMCWCFMLPIMCCSKPSPFLFYLPVILLQAELSFIYKFCSKAEMASCKLRYGLVIILNNECFEPWGEPFICSCRLGQRRIYLGVVKYFYLFIFNTFRIQLLLTPIFIQASLFTLQISPVSSSLTQNVPNYWFGQFQGCFCLFHSFLFFPLKK